MLDPYECTFEPLEGDHAWDLKALQVVIQPGTSTRVR